MCVCVCFFGLLLHYLSPSPPQVLWLSRSFTLPMLSVHFDTVLNKHQTLYCHCVLLSNVQTVCMKKREQNRIHNSVWHFNELVDFWMIHLQHFWHFTLNFSSKLFRFFFAMSSRKLLFGKRQRNLFNYAFFFRTRFVQHVKLRTHP